MHRLRWDRIVPFIVFPAAFWAAFLWAAIRFS